LGEKLFPCFFIFFWQEGRQRREADEMVVMVMMTEIYTWVLLFLKRAKLICP